MGDRRGRQPGAPYPLVFDRVRKLGINRTKRAYSARTRGPGVASSEGGRGLTANRNLDSASGPTWGEIDSTAGQVSCGCRGNGLTSKCVSWVATRQPEEVETLAAELGSVYGPLVIVGAYCGSRPRELIALKSRDIDRAEGVLRVERAYSYGS